MTALTPIDPALWSDEPEPHLMGGRLPNGEIVFPMPVGDAARDVEPCKLSRKGTLWSWTRQDFCPKEPYEGPGSGPEDGPQDFKPYLIGYVELPGEVIVETRIVDAVLEDLTLGMAMEFCVVPFNDRHTTFAFRPEQ
ncbi:OB-fold domain-containing protein [Altererythrobacter sp. H2]|uniref:Zn-ribbon domain-containing OB-fold protein n=1 Tax=Altererythrobacter sp. H2 TaxID=3108391 RepID=UPI002B4C1543|nr:OB-fold domain-containing protein [Altererythrobacter sp. H2]WRK95943.1 OB-fold domain-containing protein [Altererythrobacter sp. H2]